jgi:hypothetical protein
LIIITNRLNHIRQIIPDQFENLIPILYKLRIIIIIIIPKIFIQMNNSQLTNKQFIEPQIFILLMKKDQEYILHKRYLEHLNGTLLSEDNYHSLREYLSFQGQLALLTIYKD